VRYQQPYGVSDPNAPYINGDPSQGRQGSIPPAAAFEQPQRELVGVIEKSGFTPSNNDLLQLARSVRAQYMNYAVATYADSSNPNSLTVAYDPPITNADYRAGLTLHVRVMMTNVGGQVSIDAGGGRIPIHRMNNSDLTAGDLPIRCIATLIHDGSNAFQLSNFGGGAGGDVTYESVNLPYEVDESPTPGEIWVNFPNMPLPLVGGNVFAVKVANTAGGPTQLYINDNGPGHTTPGYPLLPNGGGTRMLQGDIVAGDVVQFFYDDTSLRFPPNPEINAAVEYTVGPVGQQFPNIDAAMDELKRKIIGANGRVTLTVAPTGATPIVGPIVVAHPSGDRITIQGTMIGLPPTANEFAANGSSQAQRDQDAGANRNLLLTRYGTVIQVQDNGGGVNGTDYGVRNTGAGRILFKDLLILGTQPALGPNDQWWQVGLGVPAGLGALVQNVSVWGCHCGFQTSGAMGCNSAFAVACTMMGHSITGQLTTNNGGAMGNAFYGHVAAFGSIATTNDRIQANGSYGVFSSGGAGAQNYWGTVLGNGVNDYYATNASSITVMNAVNAPPASTASPDFNTTGNFGSTITWIFAPLPTNLANLAAGEPPPMALPHLSLVNAD
jgi:hypothetical protein